MIEQQIAASGQELINVMKQASGIAEIPIGEPPTPLIDPAEIKALGEQYAAAMEAITERFVKMDSIRRGAFLDGLGLSTLSIHRAACNLDVAGKPAAAAAFHHLGASIDAMAIELKGIRRQKAKRRH